MKSKPDDDDLREEIEAHIAMRADFNRDSGQPAGEALANARRQFGNATLVREEVRRLHVNLFLENLLQDFRYAIRGFLRQPVFTAAALIAAALGIGSTTAVFSVVDRILFRSLPYPHDEQLVSLGMMTPLDSSEFLFAESYFDWRKHQTPFRSVTSFTAGIAECDLTDANPARLSCARVEQNFLPTLGLPPVLGRNFLPQEDIPNGPKVALVSYALWQGRFASDPNMVGRTVPIDGQPVAIVGVLPANFEMPTIARPDFLIPEVLDEGREHNGRLLRVFARLKPGVAIQQAREAMHPLWQRTLATVPRAFQKEVSLALRPLRDRQIHDALGVSWVLFGSVCAVLLIACANIANLLLARSTGRRKEMAVRAALGAARGRLIVQTLSEAVLLGVAGGVAGCGLAWILLRIFIGLAPDAIPRLDQAALDIRVLIFALICSIAAGLLFGMAPAFENPAPGSLTGSRSTGGSRTFLRESLVAAQIAVSLMLLAAAGLLLRSLWKIESVPLGIETEHVLTAEFVLGKQGYTEAARQLQFFDELERRLARTPGITAFAISDSLPPSGVTRARPLVAIQVEGRPPLTDRTGGMITWRYITPGYFATLGIPIVQGRAFQEDDRSAAGSGVILSQTFARRLFPNGDAIGKRIKTEEWYTIIGVAADVRNLGPTRAPEPEYYVVRKPVIDAVFSNQMPPYGWRSAKVAIRTSMKSKVMVDWLKRDLAELDPALPVKLGTMHERVGKLIDRPRFNALLLGMFAGMGVLLASIGLYGVMAFLVGQRTQEIGVRMALGATPQAIVKLILRRASLWAGSGVMAGLAGAVLATRAIRAMLFEVPADDPWTLAASVIILLAIALAAAWTPSLRASRIDPMTALRHE